MTASLYDFHQTMPSPQERFKALLMQIARKKPSPAKGDSFPPTTTDAEGDGINTTTSPGTTSGQN